MATMRPIAIDFFAGAGGMSLGFEQAGFDVVGAVEFDPVHAATYSYNFPQTKVICADVRKVTGDSLRKELNIGRRAIDCVFGGSPCQGFSHIGKKLANDPRNQLLLEFARLIEELKPRYFVLENVPGILTTGPAKLLDQFQSKVEKAGYRIVSPRSVLNAKDFAVPQDRKRLFILGARTGWRLPNYPAATGATTVTVKDAFADLPNVDDYAELLKSDETSISFNGSGSDYSRLLRAKVAPAGDYSFPRNWDGKTVAGCARSLHGEVQRARFANAEPGKPEPTSRLFKLSLDGLAPTLRAGTASDRGAFSAPRPIHPTYARCITVREAARLHGYPDWFRFHTTIWHGFRQVGNSVPPPLARAVGTSIRNALRAKPKRPEQKLALGDTKLLTMSARAASEHFGLKNRPIKARKRGKGAKVPE